MNIIVKTVVSILVVMVVAYYGGTYLMPSVTIVNKSGNVVDLAELALPNSNLNFGVLMDGEGNTLHYSPEQSDGVYNYHFKSKSSGEFRGSCGYVTNNQIHKRVVITIKENNEVVCA